jgi:hypothetical protein
MDRLAEAAFARADFPVETDPRKVPLEIHARPYHDLPLLADGERFLEARPRLARAIYARPDYRARVLEKLLREADADLRAMIERWRRRFPAAPPEVVEAAARDSAEGSEILARGSTPREVDLERHLCAWLGDIPAHDLFVRWEVVQIERRLAEGPAAVRLDGVLARWRALRKVLFVPSYARVLAILSPVRDRETDRIGFWRLLLPRPSWLLQRVKDDRAPPELVDLPLDLIPDLPLGLWLVDHLDRSRPEVTARWREENRRVVSLAYELRGKPRTRDPDRGFRETRVRMVLESTLAPRVELTADLSLDGSEREPRLLGLSLQQGDVREVLGPSAGPLVPHEVLPADHRDRDAFDP